MVEISTKDINRVNLYNLFDEVDNKTKLSKKLAENFKMEYDSIRQNWIYGKSVPDDKYDEALTITQKYRALEIELNNLK